MTSFVSPSICCLHTDNLSMQASKLYSHRQRLHSNRHIKLVQYLLIRIRWRNDSSYSLLNSVHPGFKLVPQQRRLGDDDFSSCINLHKHHAAVIVYVTSCICQQLLCLMYSAVPGSGKFGARYAGAQRRDLALEAISGAGQGILDSPKAGTCWDCTVEP